MRSFVIGVALLGLARSAPATEGIIEHAWKINVRSVHWLGSRLASWSIDPTRCCPSTPYVPTLVLSHVYLLNIEANSSFPHFILSRFAYCHQSSSNRTVYWAGEKLPSPVASLSLSAPFHSDCCRQCKNKCSSDLISRPRHSQSHIPLIQLKNPNKLKMYDWLDVEKGKSFSVQRPLESRSTFFLFTSQNF